MPESAGDAPAAPGRPAGSGGSSRSAGSGGLAVALISGAGRGIGRATAIELAGHGYRLGLVSRSRAELDKTAERCRGECLAIAADVSDPRGAESAVEAVVERFGRLDAIINCAGMAPQASIEQTTPQLWRDVIDVNLSSVFYTAHYGWKSLLAAGGGVIVNLSSEAARDPFPGFAAYAAAKAGMHLLAKVMAREGAAVNIRVHTLAPAAVETAMLRKILTAEQLPVDQTLDPREIAAVIVQCLDGSLSPTSGEVIYLHKTAL